MNEYERSRRRHPAQIAADERAIADILENWFTTAPEPAPRETVPVKIRPEGTKVHLTVDNTTVAFTPNDAYKMADKFTQAANLATANGFHEDN